MSFKKKMENFWYHYKFPTLAAIIFLIVVVFVICEFKNKVTYDMTIAYVGSDYVDSVTFDSVKDDIQKIVGDTDKNGRTDIRYLTMVLTGKFNTESDIAKKDQFNYTFLNSTTRVYIAEKKYFDEKSLFFMPLENILPSDILKGGCERKGKIIAAPLKNCEKLEKLGLSTDKLYIGIRAATYEDKKDKNIDDRIAASKEVMKYFLGI